MTHAQLIQRIEATLDRSGGERETLYAVLRYFRAHPEPQIEVRNVADVYAKLYVNGYGVTQWTRGEGITRHADGGTAYAEDVARVLRIALGLSRVPESQHPEEPECTCGYMGDRIVRDPACPKHGAKPPASAETGAWRALVDTLDSKILKLEGDLEKARAELARRVSGTTAAIAELDGLLAAERAEIERLTRELAYERKAHNICRERLDYENGRWLTLSGDVERLTRELAEVKAYDLRAVPDYVVSAELARRSGK
jgi:hypothetical protein